MVCKVHCMIVLLFSQYPSPINDARSRDLYVLYTIHIPVQVHVGSRRRAFPFRSRFSFPGAFFPSPPPRAIKSWLQLLCGIHVVVTLRYAYGMYSISRVLYNPEFRTSSTITVKLSQPLTCREDRQLYSVALKTCSRLRIY